MLAFITLKQELVLDVVYILLLNHMVSVLLGFSLLGQLHVPALWKEMLTDECLQFARCINTHTHTQPHTHTHTHTQAHTSIYHMLV